MQIIGLGVLLIFGWILSYETYRKKTLLYFPLAILTLLMNPIYPFIPLVVFTTYFLFIWNVFSIVTTFLNMKNSDLPYIKKLLYAIRKNRIITYLFGFFAFIMYLISGGYCIYKMTNMQNIARELAVNRVIDWIILNDKETVGDPLENDSALAGEIVNNREKIYLKERRKIDKYCKEKSNFCQISFVQHNLTSLEYIDKVNPSEITIKYSFDPESLKVFNTSSRFFGFWNKNSQRIEYCKGMISGYTGTYRYGLCGRLQQLEDATLYTKTDQALCVSEEEFNNKKMNNKITKE